MPTSAAPPAAHPAAVGRLAAALLLLAALGCQGRPNEATTPPIPAAPGGGFGGDGGAEPERLSLGATRSQVLHLNDGLRSQLREKSKGEIMANMTLDAANGLFMGMSRSADPRLVNVIETQLGRRTAGLEQRSLRSVQRHGISGDAAEGTSKTEDLWAALTMLTGMMDQTVTNYELETVKCEDFERNQKKMMATSQQDVDFASAAAASARSSSLKAEQIISTEEEAKLPSLEKQLTMTEDKCGSEVDVLKAQLSLVTSDLGTMRTVFAYFKCETTSTMLLGLRGGSNRSARVERAEDASLVRCVCQGSGLPLVQVGHAPVQAELLKLKSEATRHMVQDYLQETFAEAERRHPSQIRKVLLAQAAVALTKGAAAEEVEPLTALTAECNEDMGSGINGSSYRGCQSHTNSGRECQKWTSQSPHGHTGVTNTTGLGNAFGLGDHRYCRNPDGEKDTIWCYTSDPAVPFEYCQPVKLSASPGEVATSGCTLSPDCKVSDAGCASMRDGFLTILAGVLDKQTQLTQDIADVESRCEKAKENIGVATSTEAAKLSAAQGELAVATKSVVENQQQKSQASTAFAALTQDYEKQLKECCDSKNGLTSQLCGLQKIRGELVKTSGKDISIVDCEVSDWTDGECSVSCGGGTQERTRSIIAHPANGTKCPPMKMVRECNIQKCPIDCEVGVWSEWTECTAACGGGVKQRSRPKTVEPKFDGKPCPAESETLQCNSGACNADCELGDWGEWSGCGKPCNTGHRERLMPVRTPARGTGTCPDEKSSQRREFEECNALSCMSLLPANRSLLQCASKLDVVVLLDGSGSLTDAGFTQVKAMMQKLLPALGTGAGGGARVAVLVYGGPENTGAFDRCTGSNSSAPPNMEVDCGMRWVSHLTNDTAAVSAALAPLPYPRSTSMASMALALAKTELKSGRPDAASVVVVVTDGMVMSPIKTGKAAQDLKAAAKLIWVPAGAIEATAFQTLQGWASKPWQDHVVKVDTYNDLPAPAKVNTIIASMCPAVV